MPDQSTEKNILLYDLGTRIKQVVDTDISSTAFENGDHRRPRKSVIRDIYSSQQTSAIAKIRSGLGEEKIRKLIAVYFAKGEEIDPERIQPELRLAGSNNLYGDLFRLITSLWSIPTTVGYGRKLRWVVFDKNNEKVIGALALGEPPIALKPREEWIGWDRDQKTKHLKEVMNAYVVGSVQPYSTILGGKLITSLMGSKEISETVLQRYSKKKSEHGQLNQRESIHTGKLALVTVTSALGRSSIYNRVKLPGLIELINLGKTEGFGHFQFPDDIYKDMIRLLDLHGNDVGKRSRYGDGPNHRIRVIRSALRLLNLPPDMLRHNIYREIFAMPLAKNFREFLKGEDQDLKGERPTVESISESALQKWVIPRSERYPGYRFWDEDDLAYMFEPILKA